MKSVNPVKMLAAFALVLLVSSVTEGRIMNKCELKAKLDRAKFQQITVMEETITVNSLITRLVCKASSLAFNTSFVKNITVHNKEMKQSQAPPQAASSFPPQADPPQAPAGASPKSPPLGASPKSPPFGASPQAPPFEAPPQAAPRRGPPQASAGASPKSPPFGAPPQAPPFEAPPQAAPRRGPPQASAGAPPKSPPFGAPPQAAPRRGPPQASAGAPPQAPPSGAPPQAPPSGAPPQTPPSGALPQAPPSGAPLQISPRRVPPQVPSSRLSPQGPAGTPTKPQVQDPTKAPQNSSHEMQHPEPIAAAKVVGHLYGVFQLSDRLACDSGMMPSLNICNMTCSALTDDDITNDITCLKTVMNKFMTAKPEEIPAAVKKYVEMLVKECHISPDYSADCV